MIVAACAIALLFTAESALAKDPAAKVLGITLGMEKDDVDKRLEKIGDLEREKTGAGGSKEFWKINKDKRYAWLAIRFDDDMRVVWLTAFARQDSDRRPVRYRDIGDVKAARISGQYFYTWVVDNKGEGELAVTARGHDPDVLSSLSIYPATPHTH